MASTSTPTLSVTLAPTAEAPRRARRALQQGGLDPDLDHVVSLLVSETVANAVRHAGQGEIVVEGMFSDGYARIWVTDEGPGFDPEVRHEVSGFGLRLVDKLATDWGVEREDAGCSVWFMVDRRRRRFDRDHS